MFVHCYQDLNSNFNAFFSFCFKKHFSYQRAACLLHSFFSLAQCHDVYFSFQACDHGKIPDFVFKRSKLLILMFVETSLEVSPALSPKPLTPAVEALPLPSMCDSQRFKAEAGALLGKVPWGQLLFGWMLRDGAEVWLLWPA